MLTAGVDIGSLATKAVILSADQHEVLAAVRTASGARPPEAGRRALDEVLAQAGVERGEVRMTVATGYGRESLRFADSTVTEITCAARGAHLLDARTRTVVDLSLIHI